MCGCYLTAALRRAEFAGSITASGQAAVVGCAAWSDGAGGTGCPAPTGAADRPAGS
jgi:hypothetical protein